MYEKSYYTDDATDAERMAEDDAIQRDIDVAVEADKKGEIPADEEVASGEVIVNTFRPSDKSMYRKISFFISHQKHMLWVLQRTVSMRRFFLAPKTHVLIDR